QQDQRRAQLLAGPGCVIADRGGGRGTINAGNDVRHGVVLWSVTHQRIRRPGSSCATERATMSAYTGSGPRTSTSVPPQRNVSAASPGEDTAVISQKRVGLKLPPVDRRADGQAAQRYHPGYLSQIPWSTSGLSPPS